MRPPIDGEPASRAAAIRGDLIEDFLEHCREEDPRLHARLRRIDAQGRVELAGILGRFARRQPEVLDPVERLFAYRVLDPIRKPACETLTVVNKILDYLDLDVSSSLDEEEMKRATGLLDAFARAESDNDTLSGRELHMLYAVLRHVDADSSGRLEPAEIKELSEGLKDPSHFLDRFSQVMARANLT